MNGTMIANLVSGLFCISKDNCRRRKKVLIDRRARSTSPQGSRLVKSIPVKGVTFVAKQERRKISFHFLTLKITMLFTQWSRIQKNPLFNISIFYGFQWDLKSELTIFFFKKKRLWVRIVTRPFFVLLKKVVGSSPGIYIDEIW